MLLESGIWGVGTKREGCVPGHNGRNESSSQLIPTYRAGWMKPRPYA